MPPKLPLPHKRGLVFLFQNCPRGEGHCAVAERQRLSRGNFCLAALRCLSGPSGIVQNYGKQAKIPAFSPDLDLFSLPLKHDTHRQCWEVISALYMILMKSIARQEATHVAGKWSLDSPEKRISTKCPKLVEKIPENVQKLSGGAENTIFRTLFGHVLPVWSMLLFGDPVQCSPVTKLHLQIPFFLCLCTWGVGIYI